MKQGIFIEEINEKHVWLIYYHNDVAIYKQPLAKTFRDYLEPFHQTDHNSGEIGKGFQPETALAKLRLKKSVDKEIDIA